MEVSKMKATLKQVISILIIVFLMGSLLIGCTGNGSDKTSDVQSINEGNDSSSNNNENTDDKKEEDVAEQKNDETIKLTYWATLNNNAATVISNLGEVEMVKEWLSKFNVEVTFKHPPAGQEREQFNLIIASRDLPDLIEYNWLSYPGGPEKAISDNIIIKLNELVDNYAPNFKNVLETNELINKQVRTDEGSLYVFPAYSGSKYHISGGLMLRKDWLDDLGLSVPETVEEWTNVLTKFKEEKGSPAPFTADAGTILNVEGVFNDPFKIGKDFYLDNGKVKYGPMEPRYKEFLQLMHDWYENGLLDPDFAANDSKAIDSRIIEGQSGALFTYIGGGMGKYLNAMKDDPKFDMVAAQYPVMNKGDKPQFVLRPWEYRGDGSVAITTANKYPERSAELIDYLYSEEGALLKNFGIEGLSYNMENGYPKYTDLILNNPDGLSMAQALGKYTRGSYPSPGYIDGRYHEQYFQLPQQKEAANLWAEVANNALDVLVPPITHTPDEAEEVATIMATVNSYQEEMAVKFIMGQESFDNFDKYVQEMKKMNIERAIELKQAALDRYNNR